MASSCDQNGTGHDVLLAARGNSAVSNRRESAVRGDDDIAAKSKSEDNSQNLQQRSQPFVVHMRSTNTSYEEHSMLTITKPTFVPNNTPVQSPPESPQLSRSSTKATHSRGSATATPTPGKATLQNSQLSTSSASVVPPTTLPPIRLREVLCNDDNGGCLPPKPENVTARGGENDHVTEKPPELTTNEDGSQSTNKSQREKGNSPISIINRRNFFNTSDSRSSSSYQPMSGHTPSSRTKDDASTVQNSGNNAEVKLEDSHNNSQITVASQEPSKFGDRRTSSGHDVGIAPTIFYFDKDRSITDPHVKHDQANEKITISSWLGSKQNAEMYSLIDGNSSSSQNDNNNAANDIDNRNDDSTRIDTSSSSSNKRPYSSDGFASPQLPRSALSMSSSLGGPGGLDLTDSTLDPNNRSRRFGEVCNEEDEENYVPPPPPRFINSKLDGLRTRLLVSPRGMPPKFEEDMGTATAAAVLSNMRSSPFRFSDGSPKSSTSGNIISNKNNNCASRPGSSSFSSSKSYPRPIIRVHQRESPIDGPNESAVLDDNDNDDEGDDYEDENGDMADVSTAEMKYSKRSHKRNGRNRDVASVSNKGKKHKTGKDSNSVDVPKEVTWNKNGKRVVPRKILESVTRRRRAKVKNVHTSKEYKDDGSCSDTGKEDEYNEDSKEDEDDQEYSAKTETGGHHKKNSMGSRSRTGCWICRLRKKKCTEERPNCYNCERLNLECNYEVIKPDFVSDPVKKQMKLEEIKKKTKEAKRNAMRKKPFR